MLWLQITQTDVAKLCLRVVSHFTYQANIVCTRVAAVEPSIEARLYEGWATRTRG